MAKCLDAYLDRVNDSKNINVSYRWNTTIWGSGYLDKQNCWRLLVRLISDQIKTLLGAQVYSAGSDVPADNFETEGILLTE